MRREITLYEYIASHPPSAMQAKKIMEGYGYEVSFRNADEFVNCLKEFIKSEKEAGNSMEALKALAMAHPDRDLILSTADESHSFDGFRSDIKPIKIINDNQPAATNNPKPETRNQKTDYTPLLITGFLASALFLSVAILAKK